MYPSINLLHYFLFLGVLLDVAVELDWPFEPVDEVCATGAAVVVVVGLIAVRATRAASSRSLSRAASAPESRLWKYDMTN